MHKTLSRYLWLIIALAMAAPVSAQTLQVRHDHDPWGACEGELQITEDGIRYDTDKEEHNREWAWIDIQGFDRHSSETFSVLSYEDFGWHLGLDRAFDFTILPGEPALVQASFERIEEGLARPITDRVPKILEPEYEVAVKHRHVFGGCEGTLRFGDGWVVYTTDHAEDARSWRQDHHIANVWSSNPFELELRVWEENRRAFDKAKRFVFQLKEPLDRDYYETLRREFLLAQ